MAMGGLSKTVAKGNFIHGSKPFKVGVKTQSVQRLGAVVSTSGEYIVKSLLPRIIREGRGLEEELPSGSRNGDSTLHISKKPGPFKSWVV